MHSQYIRSMDRELVREGDAFLWLSRGDLKGETESEIIAPQDQALPIKLLGNKILQTETDSCKQLDERVKHNIPAGTIVAKEQYTSIKRHDGVCAQIHLNICWKME